MVYNARQKDLPKLKNRPKSTHKGGVSGDIYKGAPCGRCKGTEYSKSVIKYNLKDGSKMEGNTYACVSCRKYWLGNHKGLGISRDKTAKRRAAEDKLESLQLDEGLI